MKTKYYYLFLTILILGYSQKSFSQDTELSNRLMNQINEITNQTNRNNGLNKPVTRNCVTSILLEAKKNWERLTPEAKSTFNALSTRHAFSGTEITASTTNFRYHYTFTGTDKIPSTDADNSGYPDYVEQMAGVFENVWTQYKNRNYTMPPLDGAMGGDSLYDVYIFNIANDFPPGGLYYGAVSPESVIGDNPQSSAITELTAMTSFMKMNNDYSWVTTTTILNAIKITAAHEFFHAIQFGTETGNTNFFMEATAAWSEDEIYPNIDDNLQYLSSTFNYPDVALNLNRNFDNSLTSQTGTPYEQHWYGAWIFFRYLSDNTNSDVIRQILNSTIDYYEIRAIDYVLNTSYNISFDTVFKYYLTSLDVLNSNSSYAPYTYTKATTYKNYLVNSCSGICYEKKFNFTGNQLLHSSLTTTSASTTFGNGRLMRLGADYFDITANQNFKVRCLPTVSGSPIQTMLLKYNLTNGTVVRVEGQLVNGYIETAVSDYQNYDAYTLIVYRPDYVANNQNSLTSEQYVFYITQNTLSNLSFIEDNVVLYPNPCKSDFFIEGKSLNRYELINSLGQIVKSSKLNDELETQKISVSDLNEGIYYLKLSGLNGISNKKIVIKK
jgi:hypothetical protein